MNQQIDGVWRSELCYNTYFDSIGLVEELFLLEAGSSEPYLELFVQDLVVREAFETITFVLMYLQLALIFRCLQTALKVGKCQNCRRCITVRALFSLRFQLIVFPLQVFHCFEIGFVVVAELQYLYSLLIEIRIQLFKFTLLLL